MPHGRMQHTAALPCGKSCLAYAANAIASTWKKNFLQTFFRLSKLWNEIGELGLIFFSNWLKPFWNPLLIICCAASFDGTDNLPIEFLGRAASNGMSQPSWRNVHIYLWHAVTFAARPCRTLPLCAVRHSVDVPLHFLEVLSQWDGNLVRFVVCSLEREWYSKPNFKSFQRFICVLLLFKESNFFNHVANNVWWFSRATIRGEIFH